jgi:hypothetical protein
MSGRLAIIAIATRRSRSRSASIRTGRMLV